MATPANYYTATKLTRLFSVTSDHRVNEEVLYLAERQGRIPRRPQKRKSWPVKMVPSIGEAFGFLKRPKTPIIASVFVTKGGVLKSSFTLNLARMAALHNIRTCVVGLDMQGDITTALGFQSHLEEGQTLEEALKAINDIQGLPDYFYEQVQLNDIVVPTSLPTLSYIPETPELVALEQSLNHQRRREYWLKTQVLDSLKENFDLILLDCPPNWNQLITNALVACDVLISPLECKINNYRNFKMFETFVSEFQRDMNLQFQQVFLPSRLTPNRKLSREIRNWYERSLPHCTRQAIRDSVQGEEATAMHLSVPEYAPQSQAAEEMKQLLREVWSYIEEVQPKDSPPQELRSQTSNHKKATLELSS